MKYIENYIKKLLKDNSWKAPAIVCALSLAVLILLDSVLFTIIIGLLKIFLGISGLLLLGYAAYLAYPVLLKKYKESR